ncbi:ABC-F family ATP-binding cassette domain-containing protein [Actinokineospora enzanensis]|uniref:ABC-F family ATP-binding cassette domain-containing protein n=1 Tax=Actinokineospora enzanensis TaxID=155975 RepID=UPI000686B098|nr:ABC-F family ATP-binding cassette domain-containing protein [Actinokineospora enzanensis]
MSDISIHARDLGKAYGDRRVLHGVSITAGPGQRLGLVGENGVGKSTLLRLLAGVEEPDSGFVVRPADCGFLLQELPFGEDAVVGDVIDDALSEIRAARRRLDELGSCLARDPDNPDLLAAYGEVLDWAQDHDLWDADRRAELVLTGLGLAFVDRDRPLSTFSGGQRSRLGLAALLIRQPMTMLLDEPTNHLDDAAVAFLERQLGRLPGTVVVASHDRVFLDEVCTDIVDLDPTRGGLTRFGGTYTAYLAAKRAERARWEQQWAREQDELAGLRVSVDVTAREISHNRVMKDNNKIAYDRHGGRVQRQISRRVRNAQLRLDELTRTQVRRPPAPLRFYGVLTGNPPPDKLVVSLRQVRLCGRLDLDELDVSTSSRLMVQGENGAGKSTLLKVLAGILTPDTGTVRRAHGVRVALLEQDVVFASPEKTARQLYAGEVPLVELGLLSGRDLDKPVGRLSVGQRRRLALAMLIGRPPEVLLLDEPTNHLSLALAEELEQALQSAPGAVVVATHDRWLRRTWDGAELVLADGKAARGLPPARSDPIDLD